MWLLVHYIVKLKECTNVVRAAEHGNVEALIKLGIAYLYNEGRKYDKQ